MNWDIYWAVMGAIGAAVGIVAVMFLWGWVALELFDWPAWVYFAVPVALIILGLPFLVGALA